MLVASSSPAPLVSWYSLVPKCAGRLCQTPFSRVPRMPCNVTLRSAQSIIAVQFRPDFFSVDSFVMSFRGSRTSPLFDNLRPRRLSPPFSLLSIFTTRRAGTAAAASAREAGVEPPDAEADECEDDKEDDDDEEDDDVALHDCGDVSKVEVCGSRQARKLNAGWSLLVLLMVG